MPKVPTRKTDCRRVSTLSGALFSAENRRTGQRGLTQQTSAGNGRSGPAMRPRPSHAAESSVGELAARESESAQCRHPGRERGELQPAIWPATFRRCGPYCVCTRRCAAREPGSWGAAAVIPLSEHSAQQEREGLAGGGAPATRHARESAPYSRSPWAQHAISGCLPGYLPPTYPGGVATEVFNSRWKSLQGTVCRSPTSLRQVRRGLCHRLRRRKPCQHGRQSSRYGS